MSSQIDFQRLVGDFLTPAFLTTALRTDPKTNASLGTAGAVAALTIEPYGKRGKTGSHLLRIVLEYTQLPPTAVRNDEGDCEAQQPEPIPTPPSSLLVKVAARRLNPGGPPRTSWMAEQDAREVSFYRDHRHRLRLPAHYHAHTQWPIDTAGQTEKAQTCISCIVMEDLSLTHHSGDDAVAPLFYG